MSGDGAAAAPADPGKWDRAFGAFGGRLFTLGALLIAVAVATVAAVLAPQLFDLPRGFADAHHGDIDAFIRAGDLAVSGRPADAYDAAIFQEELGRLLWFYPPHALFFAAPFGAAPFVLVRPIWIALTLVAMIAVVRRAGLRDPLSIAIMVASPAVFVSLYFLQVGAFIALGLTAGLLLAPTRPILAGVIFGLLTMKPQYGLLVPVFLAATGAWRTIAAAAATTALLVALSLVFFGVEAWSAFLTMLREDYASFAGIAQPAAVSAGQLAIKLGAGAATAMAAQGAAIAVAAAVVFVSARKLDCRTAAGLAILLSLAASPSAWTYDWPIVAAALAVLANRAPRGPSSAACGGGVRSELTRQPDVVKPESWPAFVQAAALALWIAPFFHLFGASAIAAPILLFAFAALAVAWLLSTSGRRQCQAT